MRVSMMKTLAVLLVLALAASAVVGEEAELIVAKTVLTRNPVVNQEMMVSVRIFNVGSGPAYDITLNDMSWLRENFTAEAGILGARWEKLAAGQNITHNFVVIPSRPTVMRAAPATVSYHSSARGGKELTAFSSIPNYGYLRIYRANEVPNRSLPHYFEWTVFAALIAAALALPAVLYTSSKKSFASAQRK